MKTFFREFPPASRSLGGPWLSRLRRCKGYPGASYRAACAGAGEALPLRQKQRRQTVPVLDGLPQDWRPPMRRSMRRIQAGLSAASVVLGFSQGERILRKFGLARAPGKVTVCG